jgi:hypothetical protein
MSLKHMVWGAKQKRPHHFPHKRALRLRIEAGTRLSTELCSMLKGKRK